MHLRCDAGEFTIVLLCRFILDDDLKALVEESSSEEV